MINACWNALCEARRKYVGLFWKGPDNSYNICLSKPCARISRLLSLIDAVTTLLTALSILTEKEEHSFLNIDLLINPNVSC